MRKHCAFGLARRAGGITKQRHVVGAPLRDFGLDVARMQSAELAAKCHDGFEGAQGLVAVMEHAARVLIDHQPQLWQLRPDGEDLVRLLLVFGDHHAGFGVLKHVNQLIGRRVLVERGRRCTEALRGDLRRIEPRPVVADHRQHVAALEADRRQAKREFAHLSIVLRPALAAPDAHRLLAHRGRASALGRIAHEQARDGGVRRQVAGRHAAFFPNGLAPR